MRSICYTVDYVTPMVFPADGEVGRRFPRRIPYRMMTDYQGAGHTRLVVYSCCRTGRSLRDAALAAGALGDIREWKTLSRNASADAWVFASETGKTPLSRDNLWRRHIGPQLEAAGLGFVDFHVMRRTHATVMTEIHDDPQLVADQLGHTLDVNQNVYTRASVASRREAVDARESALPVM